MPEVLDLHAPGAAGEEGAVPGTAALGAVVLMVVQVPLAPHGAAISGPRVREEAVPVDLARESEQLGVG